MVVQRAGDVDYPTSDGRPMGETELHREQISDLIRALKRRYEGRGDVWASGNVLVMYEPGKGRVHVSPDVMVVFGVSPHLRERFIIWEEKAVPAAVIEITSKSTRREDMTEKKDLYLRLGVREYYVFDPTHDYLRPPLQGWHASAAGWVPLTGEPLRSAALGVDLRIVDGRLRLFDTDTGQLQLTPEEAERQRADAERQRADAEGQRADDEHRRRQEAEEEVARLLRRIDEMEKYQGG